jgi:hypothetical protein
LLILDKKEKDERKSVYEKNLSLLMKFFKVKKEDKKDDSKG